MPAGRCLRICFGFRASVFDFFLSWSAFPAVGSAVEARRAVPSTVYFITIGYFFLTESEA
jgi:hypothetical protein